MTTIIDINELATQMKLKSDFNFFEVCLPVMYKLLCVLGHQCIVSEFQLVIHVGLCSKTLM
jgi:hypothetical protein